MGTSKICVSVCAETADEFIIKIQQAEEFADVIELRFDCLKPDELNTALQRLSAANINKPLLATYRSKDQGGKNQVTLKQREAFWRDLPNLFWSADLEEDVSDIKTTAENRIVSFHDFNGVPEILTETYKRLAASDPDIVKIAVQTNDITDAIPLWKLLARARSEDRHLIPIAMGEAGKWTRILGLAHGSPLTYASLESGNETAPGQISAKDLIEIYRAKELNENTDVYGIIGGNTSYSMSPYIHNAAFMAKNLNAVFVPLQTANLDEFVRRMVKPETREIELKFAGFSVTAPHKQAIMQHLDEIDETAKAIAAVNTVKVVDGKLHGFNTDAEGFIRPLKNLYGDLSSAKIAVVGAGGAARAVVYSLSQEKANVTIFARNSEKAKDLAKEFGAESNEISKRSFSAYDILVNTTPLGTKGVSETESIATADQLNQVRLVYDIVYNPTETKLLREARKAGSQTINGVEMLVGQAVRQFEIWTGEEAPRGVMMKAVQARIAS
jgi:3-dehydroquinate dehydratase/shikimate dehydrogenase